MNKGATQTKWIEVAAISELPEGSGKTVRLSDKEVAVFKLANGRVKAIENRCPHKNGVLAEGIVCGDFVFCPLHDRKIELGTGLVQAPDTGCVKTFEVRILGGVVYVACSEQTE